MKSRLKRILSSLNNTLAIIIIYSIIALFVVYAYGSSTVNSILKSDIQNQSESISGYMENVYTTLDILSHQVESNIYYSLNDRLSELTLDSSKFSYKNGRIVMLYKDNEGNNNVAVSLDHSIDKIKQDNEIFSYINAIVISGKSFNKVINNEYSNIFFVHDFFIGMAPYNSAIQHIYDTGIYNRDIWLDYANAHEKIQDIRTSDAYRCYTNNDIVTTYISIYNKDKFVGILGLDLYTDIFDNLINANKNDATPSTLIYNDRGATITYTGKDSDAKEYKNLENIAVNPSIYYSNGYLYFHQKISNSNFNISERIRIMDWIFLILKESWILIIVFILIFILLYVLRKRVFELDRFIKTDYLTGAYSRNKFTSDFKAKRLHGKLIAYVDVNKFKRINDNFGHSFGDWYLIQITKRLGCNDTFEVYRNSGDEFFIASKFPMKEQVFRSFLPKLSEPVYYKESNLTIDVSVSLGIVENIDDSLTLEDILVYIDYAMYKAKKAGEFYTVVDKELMDEYNGQRSKENSLIKDVDNKKLFPYYHPIIDNYKHNVTGFEVLARWEYKNEILAASKFISAAKKVKYMQKIDKLIFDKVQQEYLQQKQQGVDIDDYFFSFNLSMTTVDLFNSNLNEFDIFVENAAIPKDKIIFEISEEINLSRVSNETITYIMDRGFNIVIDDFGTGVSNLSDIMNYKFFSIKTDMSMLPENEQDESKHLGFCFLVDIINTINSRVCAEGVETKEQLDIVKYTGARFAQGYLFSKPVNLDEAIEYADEFFKKSNF